MWRRGERLYALLVFLVVVLESLALGNELAQKALWKALSDPSFYVRRAAAEGLLRVNRSLLLRAAEAHPDPYGRAMAQQVLREVG